MTFPKVSAPPGPSGKLQNTTALWLRRTLAPNARPITPVNRPIRVFGRAQIFPRISKTRSTGPIGFKAVCRAPPRLGTACVGDKAGRADAQPLQCGAPFRIRVHSEHE